MEERVAISVIIPTMNRPETLERTLSTIMTGIVVPDQIIIVDQTQDKDKRTKIEKLAVDYHAQLYFHKEPSLTAARNIGWRKAIHDILIFSDDDIDVYPETIANVWELMQRKDLALIAGLDDNAGTSKTNIGYLFGTKSFRKRNIGHVTLSVLGRYPDVINGEVQTEWAMGYFFICRKSNLEKWDIYWDERLISYAYAEDLDFSYRYCKKANSLGLKCILTEKVHVKHLISSEYRIPSRKSTYMYVIHRRYIAEKNRCGSYIAITWSDIWRIFERIVKNEKPWDIIVAIKKANELEKKHFSDMETVITNI